MATTRLKHFCQNYWSKLLFCLGLFFTTVCFVDTWRTPFFLSNANKPLKFGVIILISCGVTVIEYLHSKRLDFIGKATSVIAILFVGFYIFDSLTTKWIACFGSFMIIYHLGYGLVSVWTVFLTASIIKALKKQEHNYYTKFYNSFFIGEAVMLGFIFVLIYFVIRDYNQACSINLKLFNGELKATFEGRQISGLVRTLGNVFVYSAMALTAIRFTKKQKLILGAAIPIIISALCETFQYFTACGDADIDDIFTNALGVIIGLIIHQLFIKPLLRR